MSVLNTKQTYGSVARLLHWLLAILIICMLAVGLLLGTLHSSSITGLHKLIGLAVLTLVLISIIWNTVNVRPDHPPSMPKWQHRVAISVQHLMMLCALLMPISGWIFSTAAGKPPHIGSLLLPMPYITPSPALFAFFRPLHTYVAYLLIALVSLHVLASLYHHFILKDDVLKKMMKG
ncbi:MAG: cytochrome b [Legionellales bacterium]|nr:cytochrome b [Legionellales bacterium]